MGKGRLPNWGTRRLCWCFMAEALAVSAGRLWAQVTPLLLRVPSMLCPLSHLGHQLPSTTPSDSDFRSQTSLGSR